MKKALALVLALVLALSLGVSAFALTLVPLVPESGSSASVVDISKYQLTDWDSDNEVYLVSAKGGTFYLKLDGDKEYKDIAVSGTGIVSAKLVDYDPDKMTGADTLYRVEKAGVEYDLSNDSDVVAEVQAKSAFQTGNKTYKIVYTDGTKVDMSDDENTGVNNYLALDKNNTLKSYVESMKSVSGWENVKSLEENLEFDTSLLTSYDYNKALAKALNSKYKTTKFAAANYNEDNIYVIELTVASNYSAAYKTGSVKVTATEIERNSAGKIVDKTPVSGTIDIISDVAIFEYEMVKWAGRVDEALVVENETGYSDFLTDVKGYGDNYDEAALRGYKATVISTTAFRALRENKYGIKVDSEDLLVTIPEVASSQKGVNFAAYGVDFLNAKGKSTTKNDVVKVVFGFYGDQVIASDFTIEADLGINAYELRERFGEKVEEEDIITYHVLKDGKLLSSFTVDYMKDDIDEDLELKIEGKAGSTLGQYEIVIEVPAESDNKGETNPNTGAESVIGVVAAMAVVSVAAAAAVSLKK